jgi:hypothetical protein
MKQKRLWSSRVIQTGSITLRPLHESLAAYAEAKARKKSDRLAKKLRPKGVNFHPKTGTLPRTKGETRKKA